MNKNVQKYAIIVAGGSGSRMQSELPKQFILLDGKPIIFHTIERFLTYSSSIKIVVVLPQNQIEYFNELIEKYNHNFQPVIAFGGKTRFHSVKNGLEKIGSSGIVFIHDAVRPIVSQKTIENCCKTAIEKGNAIPSIPVTDSIRKIANGKNNAVNRNEYVLIQTPQTFDIELIKKYYQQEYSEHFTDDASVLENKGEPIRLVEGNIENIKITYPEDIAIAENLLRLI